MQYVNIHGSPLFSSGDLATKPLTQVKNSGRVQRTQFHDGFLVLGFPPDKVEQAQKKAGEAFDLAMFLRNSKPSRVRSKPYEVKAAAEDCARLAARAGWLDVRVEAKSKGCL